MNQAEKTMNGQPMWQAGEARPASIDSVSAVVIVWRFSKEIGKGIVAISLLLQALSMNMQAYREYKAGDAIGQMRSEREWMKNVGIGVDRRVGIVASGKSGQEYVRENVGAFASSQVSWGGWDLTSGTELVVGGVEKITGQKIVDRSFGVSAPIGQTPHAFGHDMGMSYRHEEGHARMFDQESRAGAPSAWPEAVSAVISASIDRINGFGPKKEIDSSESVSYYQWRLKWMAGLRGEAYADAFSVLTAARKGRGAMADAALKTHAYRLFNGKHENRGTSTRAAGGIHSVEMASFIVGQFDENEVARLDSQGLDKLASRVADHSMAWALARQAPLLDFFSDSGCTWWMKLSAREGQPPDLSLRSWEAWKNSAMGERPEAVFGSFEHVIDGVVFKARGLEKETALGELRVLSQNESAVQGRVEREKKWEKALWRFDGYGGKIVMAENTDSPKKPSGNAVIGIDAKGALAYGDADAMVATHEFNLKKSNANQATMSAHLTLASRLGRDPVAEINFIAAESKSVDFSTLVKIYAKNTNSSDALGEEVRRRLPQPRAMK